MFYLLHFYVNNAAEESVKKMKRSCAEPAVPPLLQLASEEQTGVENAVFRNFPPVVAPALVPPLTPAIGSGQATEPSTTAPQVPHPVITVDEPRLPPPAGQPILKRLPSELVGDLLQVCMPLYNPINEYVCIDCVYLRVTRNVCSIS